jgi:hypothetical protein
MLEGLSASRKQPVLSFRSPAVAAVATVATVAIAIATATAATTTTAPAAAAAPATAATTAATPAPAAAAAAAEAPAAAATAAAAATRLTFLSFVYANGTTFNQRAVQLRDCILRFLRAAHRDETEPTRLAALAIGDDVNVHHFADRSEGGTQRLRRRLKRQIAYVQTITHGSLSTRSLSTALVIQ